MKMIRKALDHLIRIERFVCCALLVAILAICFGSVVMRCVFNAPWAWSEEVIVVLLVWFGFLCMSIETYQDSNMAFSGLYNRFPEPVQRVCDVARHLLLAVFCYLMTTNGYKIFLLNTRKRMPASHWNRGWQHFPMVLGGALMFVFSILNIIGALTGEKRPKRVPEGRRFAEEGEKP